MKSQQTFQLLILLLFCFLFRCTLGYLGYKTDQLALLEFKYRVGSTNEIMKMWNESVSHCQWPGIKCGHKHHRVVALDLSDQNLFGPISPHLGNLSFLRHINFSDNSLNGEIPKEIGRLLRLRNFILFNNTVAGAIPANLSYCKELNILDLAKNNLTGEIPIGLGTLEKLVTLYMDLNGITGEIPSSLGNLSSLQNFVVAENNLQGTIPNDLSKLASLAYFAIGINNISGVLPPSLFNISSIVLISTAYNMLRGTLPSRFMLPNLTIFGIGRNLFTGTIPESFANSSQLTLFDIDRNSFSGQVPHSLGSLPSLQNLGLGINQLGGDPIQDLSFLEPLSNCTILTVLALDDNNMMGKLPDAIANLSIQLESLYMGRNKISGTIPKSIGNFINLYNLAMEKNRLSGFIPSSLGRLKNLQQLTLNENLLSGKIPSSLGDISGLSALDLSNNRLEGGIPESIGSYERIHYLGLSNNTFSGTITPQIVEMASLSEGLDLSNNQLAGPLPSNIGKLINLNALILSHNNLSGEIPMVIGNCLSLESLNLSRNSFRGTIPDTLANLRGIRYLDLSQNSLSGKLPQGIENLPFLQYLDLSFNDLEGEIPTTGVFGNVSAISLVGNSKLCGGIPELELPPCPNIRSSKNHTLTIVLVTVVVFFILISLIGVLYWKRKKIKVLATTTTLEEGKLVRISFWELHRATNGFSSENLIGSGSFGTVYKGKLNQQMDKFLAVKVLNLQNNRASKSFVAECKILRSIRHRNLVKILTYCSSIDHKQDEFKALVFEYMPNGNLDMWLHPVEPNTLTTLNFLQRLNVAHDVASALHYLHNDCKPPIIHCDVKPSNVLLDNEMCARLGDFGLARFFLKESGVVSATGSIGVKGTIGYAAPEYGTGSEMSMRGDVYAYGILLLEMITGRRPTDSIFIEGLNLHNYVKEGLRNKQVMEIVDPVLGTEQQETQGESEDDKNKDEIVAEMERSADFEKNIIAVLNIALACTEESPTNRMDMNGVTRELYCVKCAILGTGANQF